MKRLIRILLADDHALVRAGIRSLLERLEGVEIVGEAGDGHETMRLVEERSPDILLLDIALPGLNGLDVARRLLKSRPDLRVIILSMHATEDYVQQALQAGAAAYLLKEATVAELELAIRAVSKGGTYLSPSVSRHVVGEYLRSAGTSPPPTAGLTERQREILQLLAEGHSTKEIAFRLGLSVKTVETHRARLMERLGIHDLAGLVRYAVRTGLVSPDP
jgi:DNA-binding NarL/FixJ family response regulator